ncbi:acyl-CoA dehydrogenase family protein, partial [Streptomyces pathocidini]|uniref:acyl-CoA dehydrogenase family protein n=1 Tax=Streptomyces pathocidini TaxID=1650571 RepID=UPI0033E051DA
MPETASAREHGARPGSQAAPPPSPPHSQPDFDALDALPRTATGRELWTALGSAGLTAWCYRDSGTVASGVHPDRLARVLAAADARFAVPTTLSASVQLATALPVLATDPRPLARRELARAVAGESAVALAATDVTAGTDLTALRTEARISDDGVEVHGAKAWIANTTTADHFLVLARHRTGRHFTHFTWVLVPADAPGVTARPADSALFASSGVGDVEFDGVRLGLE